MDINEQLKKMHLKRKATVKEEEGPPPTEAEIIEAMPKTLDEFFALMEEAVVDQKSYRTGKIDDYGRVKGIHEYPGPQVPHTQQTHYFDKMGRPLKVEIYEKDFSKPITRVYFYEGEGDKVMESVWFDRYGKIDNIHRYQYDKTTGLMTDRAEYTKEGDIFYHIHSEYDKSFEPPRHFEDVWTDKRGNLIQRYVYKYDDAGDVNIEEQYDENNQMIGYFFIEYDEAREFPVKKEWHGPGGDLRSWQEFTYDAAHNVTRVDLFDGEGKREASQIFIYDEIGNLKEEQWVNVEGETFKKIKY